MELKSLTNYKTVYSGLKLIALVTIVGSMLFSATIFIYSWQKMTSAKNTIYVIDATGNVAVASGQAIDLKTRQFEYEDHVKDFYKLWYQFDQNSFKRNVEQGLILVGECGKELYNEYKSQDMYNLLQSKNISTEVMVSEIKIDVTQNPIRGYIKGIQTIKRLNGEAKRNMNCTFSIYDVDRSQDNSHGCKIEDWKVVDNNEINSEPTAN